MDNWIAGFLVGVGCTLLLCSVYFTSLKPNDYNHRLTKIETVLIMKDIIPRELVEKAK